MATTESSALLTAEQYLTLPDNSRPSELVRGKVIEMTPPGAQHGFVCYLVARVIGGLVDSHGLGRVFSNDSGVVTERSPDSVRGADVAFYSFARLPKGPLPKGYPSVPPDVVFEVRSPSDRRSEILEKVNEYLTAGVTAVCVLDPDHQTIELHRPRRPAEVLGADDELRIPEISDALCVPVRQFFE